MNITESQIELIKKPIMVIDAESDGLYGDIFAIGAVAIQPGYPIAHILSTFYGCAKVPAVKDPWVRENIVPLCDPNYETRRQMRDDFWNFYKWYRDTCLIVADFGAPVEALLFRTCVQDDPEKRTWEGPYPLHELATLMLLKGVDPDVDREEFSGLRGRKHNPLFDAHMGAVCWLRLMLDKRYRFPENEAFFLEAVE